MTDYEYRYIHAVPAITVPDGHPANTHNGGKDHQ